MAITPFTDGFPNDAKSAITASYFLSQDDKNEWNDWLKSADPTQQDELVNILHTMWEEAKKSEAMDSGNTQPPVAQTNNQPQTNNQTQSNQSQNNFGQPTVPEYQYPQQNQQFGQQQAQQLDQGQNQPTNQQSSNNQSNNFGQSFIQPQPIQNQPQITNQNNFPLQGNQTNNQQPVNQQNNPFGNPQNQNPYLDNNYQTQNQFYNQNNNQQSQNQQMDFGNNQPTNNQQNSQTPANLFGNPQSNYYSDPNQPQNSQQNNSQQIPQFISQPVAPAIAPANLDFSFSKPIIDNQIFSQPEAVYTPTPIIAEMKEVAPKIEVSEAQIILPEPTVEPKVETTPEMDEFVFDTEVETPKTKMVSDIEGKNIDLDTKTISKDDRATRRAASASIDFTTIRENVRKENILKLHDEYIQTRDDNAIAYGGFVEKITEVLCEFEDVNDYIEAMTDKVLTMNDEVISQASDIQALKNATQNRGGSLQDQVDEVRYDLEKILKEIRNVRIEMKRSNDEIRQRLSILEADSFRQENDGINQKLTIMKSEISKLQEVITFSNSGMPQPIPTQSDVNSASRISKLDTISFKKK